MGRRTIRDEVKIRVGIALTPTTINYLDKLAEHNNLSRAEVIEQIVDSLRLKPTQVKPI